MLNSLAYLGEKVDCGYIWLYGLYICRILSIWGWFLWHTSLWSLNEQHLELGSACAQVKLVVLEIHVNFSSNFS